MKLIKCYIQNFGTLHEQGYDFEDGLNIIKKDNGFGKTTFATFIKAMFYGLDVQANARLEKSDRKRYFPWQGGIYGGNIEFEVNNKKYRVERTFGKKATEDTFKLYNLETNLESQDFSKNIGEEIFYINRSGYERTTYIPQGQVKIEMEDSISAKLGNILESDNDINTSEDALKRINEAKKVYKKDRGQGGLIDEKKAKLYDLQRKLENSKLDIENLEVRKAQLDSKIKEIENIEGKRDEEQKVLARKIEQDRLKAKKENYDSILKRFNTINEEYRKLEKFFSNGVPKEFFLEELTNLNHEIEKTKIEIDSYKVSDKDFKELYASEFKFKNLSFEDIDEKILEFTNISDTEKEIDEKEKLKLEKEEELNSLKKNQKRNQLLTLFSLLFIIIGAILFFVNISKIVGIVTLILGFILVLFRVFRKNKKRKVVTIKKEITNTQAEIEELQSKNENSRISINKFVELYCNKNDPNIMMKLTNLKAEYSKYIELQNSKTSKDEALKNAKYKLENLIIKIEQELSKFYSSFENNYTNLIQDLKANLTNYKNLKIQLQEVLNEKDNFQKENNIDEFNNIEEIELSEEDTKKNIDEYNKQIDILVDEKNQIKNFIEMLENKIEEYDYLESDIESLKEEISSIEEKYKILKTTEELLKTSKESFSSSYLKDMIRGFNSYLSIIDSKDLKTAVDTNLDVKIDVNGSQKEIKTFSAGYKDLIYICIRFSLVDALYKNEEPFVVLDDPFVNLDEGKTKKALEILKEFSKKYQVIYFSCNASRI